MSQYNVEEAARHMQALLDRQADDPTIAWAVQHIASLAKQLADEKLAHSRCTEERDEANKTLREVSWMMEDEDFVDLSDFHEALRGLGL